MSTRGKRKTNTAEATPSKKITALPSQVSDRLEIPKTYKMYVGGAFPRTESGHFYPFESPSGVERINVCRASRKDLRDAVTVARAALADWSAKSAYLRGQILYRIAEMLESRSEAFVAELITQGSSRRDALAEVHQSVDRLVYYAGWSDKYQQIFSSVNPVASSHFNFSVLEPTGVVAIVAPEEHPLLGVISNIAPAIVGGNTCILLASHACPLSAVSFGEVLHSSDLPGGVVNILTGFPEDLLSHFATHMDINALVFCGIQPKEIANIQRDASLNLKRVMLRGEIDWKSDQGQSPYLIQETQETKTTWHPIGK